MTTTTPTTATAFAAEELWLQAAGAEQDTALAYALMGNGEMATWTMPDGQRLTSAEAHRYARHNLDADIGPERIAEMYAALARGEAAGGVASVGERLLANQQYPNVDAIGFYADDTAGGQLKLVALHSIGSAGASEQALADAYRDGTLDTLLADCEPARQEAIADGVQMVDRHGNAYEGHVFAYRVVGEITWDDIQLCDATRAEWHALEEAYADGHWVPLAWQIVVRHLNADFPEWEDGPADRPWIDDDICQVYRTSHAAAAVFAREV